MSSRKILRVIATAMVATVTFSLTSCGPTPGQQQGPALEQGYGLPVDPPRVEVRSLGDGTKQVLAYHDLTADAEQAVTVSVSTGFDQLSVPAGEATHDAPEKTDGDETTITLPLTGSTSEASTPSEGQREATRAPQYRLGEVTTNAEAQTNDLASTKGFVFGWRGGDAGDVSTVMLSAPADATDKGRATIEQALTSIWSNIVVFPNEALGTGGSWSVDTRVPGDTSMLQTTTYTVDSLTDTTVTLNVEVQQRPSLGALSLDGVTGADKISDKELTVKSSSTTSSGTLTVDLGSALPIDGSLHFVTRVIYGGESQTVIAQDNSTTVKFSS